MKSTLCLFALASVSFAVPACAQTRTLIGRVVDSVTTKGVTGGEVRILGLGVVVPLREDGSFALSIPLREVTLAITVPGYRESEVQVPVFDNNGVLQVAVARDVFNQEGQVTTGQATGVGRKNSANTVGEVGKDELSRSGNRRVDQALKGRVPGAEVSVSSDPAAAMAIRLRGLTTLLGNSSPLYIVDGVIVYTIDGINPNDIEDIQLLKGASAGAMYGSRASNGVVIVKTKRGGLSNQTRK